MMKWIRLFNMLFMTMACAYSLQATDITLVVSADHADQEFSDTLKKIRKSDAVWKKDLSPVVYHIMREKGTERAFSGPYWDNHDQGNYLCAACGLLLFTSDSKFDSGTGWPSFFKPFQKKHMLEKSDLSFGMVRTEVMCMRCEGHLGHVFDDGPRPTGLRYCINGNALKFEPKKIRKN